MSSQDVAFLPYRAGFPPHFKKIVADATTLGAPHVTKLWQ